jgi:hypothetical protein
MITLCTDNIMERLPGELWFRFFGRFIVQSVMEWAI